MHNNGHVAPEPLFLVGAVSQYLGAAVAVGLFDVLAPGGTALLRVAGAGLVVVLLRRSWRRAWTPPELAWACVFGLALAGMNTSIYFAIEELPLGNAVAVEFLGPVTVAAVGTRTWRSATALALAASGVVVLAGVEASGTLRGIAFALLAGMFWAGYIVLGHRVARGSARVDGLGVGMLAGAGAISVIGIGDVVSVVGSPGVLALGLATGVLSNVIPYWIDQSIMQRIDRRRFALLQALLPVTATLVGGTVLLQVPSLRELAGIGLVIVAIMLNRDDAGRDGV